MSFGFLLDRGKMSEATEAEKGLENLKLGDHTCFIYKNTKEQFLVAIPFIICGLRRGQKCQYIVSENTKEDIIDALNKAGINTQKYVNSGQLRIVDYGSAYLSKGYFDPNDSISLLKENAKLVIKEGYKGLRVAGEMDWALNELPNSDKLIEYESKVDSVFSEVPVIGMCQYNKTKFPKEVLVNAIEIHPILVLGKSIYKNIYNFPQRELFARDFYGKESPAKCGREFQKNCPSDDPQLLYDHCMRYQQLDKSQREIENRLIDEMLELEPNACEAFCELLSGKGYGSLTLVFKAGNCIGLDWQGSHRTHKV